MCHDSGHGLQEKKEKRSKPHPRSVSPETIKGVGRHGREESERERRKQRDYEHLVNDDRDAGRRTYSHDEDRMRKNDITHYRGKGVDRR